jgi:hypothetical protein
MLYPNFPETKLDPKEQTMTFDGRNRAVLQLKNSHILSKN